MTRTEAIEQYEKRFGGFPDFLFMTASDDEVVWQVRRALLNDREIEQEEPEADY